MFPIGSSRRRLLNQSTHSRVASSMASKLRHGPRRWITSALNKPLIVSARALSYESPVLPTDGSMPASASRSVYRIDRYCPSSTGRRNSAPKGVAMTTRRRRSERAGRAKLRSPGRPSVRRREEQRRFWAAIATGHSSEDAAVAAGVSPAVGTRWFREAGGMAASHLVPSAPPLSGRYLAFTDREQIALWRAQGHGVREIARRLVWAPSTISRELRRNAATRSGGLKYRATTAQWHAERAARRSKRAKLATNPALRAYVQERLAGV